MTTIAANLEEMAGDSLVTAGGTIVGRFEKVVRVNDSLIGCADLIEDAIQFRDWFAWGADPNDKPSLGEDFAALVLTVGEKSGEPELWLYSDTCIPIPAGNGYAAIGSGSDHALGAMYVGAGPYLAVEAACELDVSTGGPITHERL